MSKKKKLILMIVSIIEIIFVVLFLATIKVSSSITMDLLINGMMNQWISSSNYTLRTIDKAIVNINNYSFYLFLITFVIRFIFIMKKGKIIMSLFLFSIFISLVLLFYGNTIMSILGIISSIISIGLYIYSHIIIWSKYDMLDNKNG